MSQGIVFAATCSRCQREQFQERYTIADLMTLLYGGYPIEVYCAAWDEFWTVSVQKRVELGDVVAAACGAVSAPPTPRMVIDDPHATAGVAVPRRSGNESALPPNLPTLHRFLRVFVGSSQSMSRSDG